MLLVGRLRGVDREVVRPDTKGLEVVNVWLEERSDTVISGVLDIPEKHMDSEGFTRPGLPDFPRTNRAFGRVDEFAKLGAREAEGFTSATEADRGENVRHWVSFCGEAPERAPGPL